MDVPTPDLEGMLLSGEDLLGVVRLDPTRLAVTTHRLIVIAPDGPGKQVETVHLPNLAGVEVGTVGGRDALRRIPRVAVYGGVLLAGGWALRTRVLPELQTGVPGTGTGIVGSVTEILGAVRTGLSVLSLLLLVAGGVAFIGVAGLLGLYVLRRNPALLVQRAGESPIACRADEAEARRAASELSSAVQTVADRASGTDGA